MSTQVQKTESYSEIEDLDLKDIVTRLVKAQKWKRKHAIKACKLYKNFLHLKKKFPNIHLVPSTDIDEVWHNHILFTNKYMFDSEKIFGKLMHHNPLSESDADLQNNENAFEITQQLYFQEFGTYIYQVRPRFSIILSKLKLLFTRL